MFYIMRFIDGLCADIKAIVLVLCPKYLDTACTVAMLQEEAGSASVAVFSWVKSSNLATVALSFLFVN